MIEQILGYEEVVNLWIARAIELISLLYMLARRFLSAAQAAAAQTPGDADDQAVARVRAHVETFFRVLRAFSVKWAAGPDTLAPDEGASSAVRKRV